MLKKFVEFLKETFDKEAIKVAFRNGIIVTGYTLFSGLALSSAITTITLSQIIPVALTTGGLVFFTELANYYKVNVGETNKVKTPSNPTRVKKIKAYVSPFFHLW